MNLKHCAQPHQWIFIDNNSDKETQEMLLDFKQLAEAKQHEVIIHREKENTGVARAWNKGMSFATRDFYCILNNDCVMQPDWDTGLMRAQNSTGLDLYSPMVFEPNQYSLELNLENFYEEELWRVFQVKNANRIAESHFSGIVFFGEKSVFEKIGTFDERLWLSMEDIDYQYRAKLLDFKIGIVGKVVAYHFVSATRKSMNYNEAENQRIFQEKWGWNYVEIENQFWNKRRRTFRKFLLRKFGLLSTWPEQFPVIAPPKA